MEMEKNQSEALYIQYFNAVEKVWEQTDLRKEEKLKLLLEPIISFQNDTFPSNRKHKFAREDHINLDEELDLSALEKKSDDWIISPDWKLRQFGETAQGQIFTLDNSASGMRSSLIISGLTLVIQCGPAHRRQRDSKAERRGCQRTKDHSGCMACGWGAMRSDFFLAKLY